MNPITQAIRNLRAKPFVYVPKGTIQLSCEKFEKEMADPENVFLGLHEIVDKCIIAPIRGHTKTPEEQSPGPSCSGITQ